MSDKSPPNADPIIKLIGAFLMAVGVLMAVLNGLCSLLFVGTSVIGAMQTTKTAADYALSALPLALIFGGIPVGAGIVIFIFGRNLYRGR